MYILLYKRGFSEVLESVVSNFSRDQAPKPSVSSHSLCIFYLLYNLPTILSPFSTMLVKGVQCRFYMKCTLDFTRFLPPSQKKWENVRHCFSNCSFNATMLIVVALIIKLLQYNRTDTL